MKGKGESKRGEINDNGEFSVSVFNLGLVLVLDCEGEAVRCLEEDMMMISHHLLVLLLTTCLMLKCHHENVGREDA